MRIELKDDKGLRRITSETIEGEFDVKAKSSMMFFESSEEQADFILAFTGMDVIGSFREARESTPVLSAIRDLERLLKALPPKDRNVSQLKIGIRTVEAASQQELERGKARE